LPGLAMTRSIGDGCAAIAGVTCIPCNFNKRNYNNKDFPK